MGCCEKGETTGNCGGGMVGGLGGVAVRGGAVDTG